MKTRIIILAFILLNAYIMNASAHNHTFAPANSYGYGVNVYPNGNYQQQPYIVQPVPQQRYYTNQPYRVNPAPQYYYPNGNYQQPYYSRHENHERYERYEHHNNGHHRDYDGYR